MTQIKVTKTAGVITALAFELDNMAEFTGTKYPGLHICQAIETLIAAKAWQLGADVEAFFSRFASDFGVIVGETFRIAPPDMYFPDHVAAEM